MLICNRRVSTAFFAISFLGTATPVVCIADSFVSKSGDTSLTMPSISAPAMPSVSSPSVDSDDSFYIPGSSSFYSGSAPDTTNAAASESTSSSASATASGNSTETSSQTATNTAASLKNSAALSALSSLTGTTPSAADLSSLDSMGALGSVSSLLGGSNGTASQLYTAQDSALLQQILSDLSDLKKEIAAQKQTNNDAAGTSKPASATLPQTPADGPKILRFMVNGYDIFATCRTVYFSKTESDGTFLLTGDRKYSSDGKARTETFYLLFHATGSRSGTTIYTVSPAVSQDYLNPYSFLYQLSQKKGLTAERTGNLVSMRLTEPAWNLDLLLDLTE